MNLENNLNDKQLEAVKYTEGPLLILAGAGSGKTKVLVHRIAYLIEHMGVSPYNIMAITFTNKAAAEMRERVERIIPNVGSSIWVMTFHASCVRMLRRFIDRIGYDNNFSIYDTEDQKTLIKRIYKNLNLDPKIIKEKTAIRAISSYKDELTSPEEALRQTNDFYDRQIINIYSEYQKALKQNNALDFDDIIVKCVELLERDEEVKEYYQEKFKYIMVDEYQDTNNAQFRLIKLLADKYKNLCVVGDDDQSIYKFRGANIFNILNFENVYKDAKLIKLEQNYRSKANILNVANAVIKNNKGRKKLEIKELETDVLIIGGGTAGCYAAITLGKNSDLSVVVAEKANIKRSGCLAAGINAINAYNVKGRVPQDYVDYAAKDANGIVRHDLLITAANRFNEITAEVEKLGLVILKDENGEYVARGNRNIKINGENFKPILADAVKKTKNVRVLNTLNITDLLVKDGKVYGAVGFSIKKEEAFVIRAKKVIISTGGAAGLYKPNNPGFSRHKMWYPPFNTGAGYAMGILAGAEMTTFEMRFIALRCKDTIAPVGTIAQGVGAKQINSKGVVYEDKYGLTTSERVYGTVRENQLGNGPCYLKTSGISEEESESLLKAYLNMAPSQTLKWIESGKNPNEQDVEIEGTEPYIVGGHTASGFWVNTNRETTINGLYAAGDVAGGCPQKYVTGALAEGEIAALDIISKLADEKKINCGKIDENVENFLDEQKNQIINQYEKIRNTEAKRFSTEDMEEGMQKIMDEYAGGISTNYQFNEKQLKLAKQKIDQLIELSDELSADNMHDLMFAYELKERLIVCKSLIEHLFFRKETRWHSFNENLDYPETDENYFKYVNSRLVNGELEVFMREIVKEERYEHSN